MTVPVTVALGRCGSYASPDVERAVGELLTAIGYHPARGEKVLVKPNLLRGDADPLCCTDPAVVRAACLYLLDHGAAITVADSPAFGQATNVARRIGLSEALTPWRGFLARAGSGCPQNRNPAHGGRRKDFPFGPGGGFPPQPAPAQGPPDAAPDLRREKPFRLCQRNEQGLAARPAWR